MPSFCKLVTAPDWSRMRRDIFSPCRVPVVATRKSSWRPSRSARNDPSWGRRFSVMSIADSTLKMLTIPSPVGRSNGSAGYIAPSTRTRTLIWSSCGSKCTSVLRRKIASYISSLAAT